MDGAGPPAWSIDQVPPPGPVRVSATRASSPATGTCATWLFGTAIIHVRTARIWSASVLGRGRPSAGAMSCAQVCVDLDIENRSVYYELKPTGFIGRSRGGPLYTYLRFRVGGRFVPRLNVPGVAGPQ
ncbi:hypothetical protein SALBM311S_11915 [Streptomyces alboniger]